MAVSINWGTKVINIPQADLTPLGGNRYRLDVNTFRLALKDLEDSDEGIAYLKTHNHNTAVTLAGVTYARTVEIINGYTVEFENGVYSVECVGANHNISDVKVVNSVSLIVGNSAGLIQVSSGSGLSAEQATQLLKIFQALMLDPAAPVRTTIDKIEFADVVINLTGDPEVEIISTRE